MKYLVPIADFKLFDTFIMSFEAESIEDCKHKIVEEFSNIYSPIFKGMHYTDFLEEADKMNIVIGEIKTINEL